jgi:hypothetical protein
MQIDFGKLKYFDPLREEAYKSISLLFPVRLDDTTATSTITITDNGIEVADCSLEKDIAISLQNYFKDSNALPVQPFLFVVNQFASPRKEHSGFELIERSRVLCLAISILTGKTCFEWATFQYNNAVDPPLYYEPVLFKNSMLEATYFDKPAVLSAKNDLESLRLIYGSLTQLGVWQYRNHSSKLLNAVRFYTHFNEDEWILQKIVFAFVVLESIFGDASKTEITEKVAIRTAYFLYPDNIDARHDVYSLLKIAYDCRSNFVHGSNIDETKINNKLRKLKQNIRYNLYFELPDELRDITSQVLRKIITNTSYFEFFSKEKFKDGEETNFYNELVLGRKDK